jgi:thiol-disulfide isomerase/thioredoxin
MSLLSPADQEKLRESFDEMTSPVKVLFFTQTLDCEPCEQTRRILDELPALSDRIAIEEVNFILEKDKAAQYGIDRVPALALIAQDAAGEARDTRIRFLGTPAGYEFVSLVPGVDARRRPCVEPDAGEPRARRRRHDADDDPGVFNTDLTALSAGGQPRA